MSIDEHMQAAEEEWLAGWQAGPQRTRWTKLPPQVGDKAPTLTLQNSQGETVSLADMWADKPALIIFWRHYGCGCGLDRALRLREEYDAYVAAGGNVVIIGQGEPERAAAYAEKYELPPVPVLCDPEYKIYEAFGLVEGKASQILFDAPDEYIRREKAVTEGFVNERREMGRPLVDNSWLLPGEFVVDMDGVLRLTYRYNYCEDFPDHRVLVVAIREANGEFD